MLRPYLYLTMLRVSARKLSVALVRVKLAGGARNVTRPPFAPNLAAIETIHEVGLSHE